MQIIVKNWGHYNSALGTYVKSKDHYDTLMKKGGYVSYEEQNDRCKNNGNKPLILSKDAEEVIKAAKLRRNAKGEVKLDGKLGEKLMSMGAINKNIPSYMKLPAAYSK